MNIEEEEKLQNLNEIVENSKKMHYKLLNSFVSEAKYNAIYRKGCSLVLPIPPKILTIKQMLKRLPTALAQVKAGNTSENL